MQIKFFKRGAFDVFVDNGWENWARFEIRDKHYLLQTGGVKVERGLYKYLLNRFCHVG